jgi:hypothetical protein
LVHTELLAGFLVVAATTAAVLTTLVLAAWSCPAATRPGLVAGGLPLGLLPPLVATAFVAAKTGGLLGGLREFGPGGPIAGVTASLWQLQALGWAGFVATCVTGAALALSRSRTSDGFEASSARRGLVLLLLPVLALSASALLTQRVAKGTRCGALVLASTGDEPGARERNEAALESEGFAMNRSGSLGRLARYLSRTTLVGTFGGATLAIVLLGLAAPGFVLAWGSRFGAGFRSAATALWLLAGAFGAFAGLGLLGPFRFS